MNDKLTTQQDATNIHQPRSRSQREATNTIGPAPLIFGAMFICIALTLGYNMGGGERTEENFMTEVEYYQRQLDVQRAEFNGYRAGVNESRGQ